MTQLLCSALLRMLEASWHAAVMAAIVLLLSAALGRWLSPRWRCALWALVFVRLILPAVPSSPWSIFNLAAERDAATAMMMPGDRHPIISVHQPQRSEPARSTDAAPTLIPAAPPKPLLIAAVTWLAVAALLILRHVIAWLMLARRLRRCYPTTDPRLLAALDSCHPRLRARHLDIIETRLVTSPALAGVIRPRLLIPPGLIGRLSPAELRFVLLHELLHLRRHDVLVNWLAAMIAAMHWFNPMVWLAAARFRAEREIACDAAVINHTDQSDRIAYGRTILRLLERSPSHRTMGTTVGMLHTTRSIRRRITAIAIAADRPRTRRLVLLGPTVCLALGCATLTGPRSATSEDARDHAVTVAPADQSPRAPLPGEAQVAVEARFISGDVVRRWDQRHGDRWIRHEQLLAWPQALDDGQVSALLVGTQQDRHSSIITAPKITLFDGQRAYVVVATETAYIRELVPSAAQPGKMEPVIDVAQSGIHLDCQASLSPDRSEVTLVLRPRYSKLLALEPSREEGDELVVQVPHLEVLEIDHTAAVPDGRWLLLRGTPQRLPAAEHQPQPLLLLIKPRVIITPDNAPPAPPPSPAPTRAPANPVRPNPA